MSFDFQLAHACPHVTIDEIVALGTDRKSLNLRQPVSSSNQVRITANGIQVPKSGLYSSAVLKGTQSGPFRVVKSENDITISNRQGLINVFIPIGSRVSVQTVVQELSTEINKKGLLISVLEENGVLKFRDNSERGMSSFIRVSGKALTSLGLDKQVAAKGKEIYPPWIMNDEEQVAVVGPGEVKSFAARFPKFIRPIRSNPSLKVSYATFRERCLRCLRTGVENDYKLTPTGDPLKIRDENLLYQASLKSILTKKGSNPYHPQYGSLLMTLIGTKSNASTTANMNLYVQSALRHFQDLQQGQSQYQSVSPRERLESVSSIQVFQSELDPTRYGIKIVVYNSSDQPVVLDVVFAVPGSIALMNSRGQSLGAFGNLAGVSHLTL